MHLLFDGLCWRFRPVSAAPTRRVAPEPRASVRNLACSFRSLPATINS
jgi:hypothetical protein